MHPSHPSSMVMTRIGSQELPMVSVNSCRTCQSPHRLMIENELVQGRSYRSISRMLDGLPSSDLPHPGYDLIAAHVRNGHLPIGPSAQRRLIDRRYEELGKHIEEAQDELVDYVTVNQMVVAKGFERLQAGLIDPSIADMLAASRFLREVEASVGGNMDEQAFRSIMHAYMETVMRFIPQERLAEFNLAMQTNPVLAALSRPQPETVVGSLLDTG